MSNAIATTNTNTLAGLLEKYRPDIEKVIPKHLTSERLTRLALSVVSRDEALGRCSPASILRSVMDAAKLGLEPTGSIGGAYLVAYFNSKTGQHEAQLMTDYRGEMELVRRSGLVRSITCHVVYELDTLNLEYGDDERLIHKPALEEDRGRRIGVYAIGHLADGTKQRVYLSAGEVEHYRGKSKSAKHGPWVTDPDAMWRKTAIRRLCNMLPRSVEHAEQMAREEEAELVAVATEEAPPAKAIEAPAAERLLAKIAPDSEMESARKRLAEVTAELEAAAGSTKAASLVGEHVKSMRGVKTAAHVLERVEQVARLVKLVEIEPMIFGAYNAVTSRLGTVHGNARIASDAPAARAALDALYTLTPAQANEGLSELLRVVEDTEPKVREPGEEG